MASLQDNTQNSLAASCINCGAEYTPHRVDQSCCKEACTRDYHGHEHQRKRALGLCADRKCQSAPEKGRAMCAFHLSAANKKRVKYTASYKEQALDAYGGRVCVGCGETDFCCLSIDHEAQDGCKHREEQCGTGTPFYQWLKRNNWPSGFRVLCMNCQFRARAGVAFPNA